MSAILIINDQATRDKAVSWIGKAPPGSRVTFQRPARTLPQNDRQWALLTAISDQLSWHGKKYTPDDWKDFLVHMYRKEARFMPDDDGHLTVPIGIRTSKFSIDEHNDFQAVISMFAAVHSVVLTEPEI